MRRRTFLKKSAMGVGALAGLRGGLLKASDASHQALAGKGATSAGNEEAVAAWGANAIALKPAWTTLPTVDEMLADNEHTIALNRFLRVGGDARAATPTECRIAYTSEALLVLFRCEERDMSFPYANLDSSVWHETRWDSMPGLPSGTETNWPPNPDEVDFLIQPDPSVPSYFQFAATPQRLKFGCKRALPASSEYSADVAASAKDSQMRVNAVDAFEADVTREASEWLAWFRIPWQTLGGRPNVHIGFLPMRTRWRDGEFSSPVAIDVNECLPVDLMIETRFAGTAEVLNSDGCLCTLPSGAMRWQRPAVVDYPDAKTQQQIWEMQTSLETRTDEKNLAERLRLAQCWMDLMMQEGFTPLPRAWGDVPVDLTLAYLRQRVNAALARNDVQGACAAFDTWLKPMDSMSRWWYADGSPGDILKSEWKPVESAARAEVEGKTLRLHCTAGVHDVELRVALPATGGVHIYGHEEGYWRPAELLPLNVRHAPDSCEIETARGRIAIHYNPFSISFRGTDGSEVALIGAAHLALRFDTDGQVAAIEYRNGLAADEAIYGFGEKYDSFNHNGRVLTLWGTDDWVGNGLGRANTTYKPLPIFHSSKGYMIFDNSSYRLRADIGKSEPGTYRITQHGPIFDFYFWIGAPEERLQSYTALTGTPPLPPKWAFEPWMGRGEDAWAEGPLHDPVKEEENTAQRFAGLDIPHSAIYAEGATALSSEVNQFMAERGIRVLGYFMPAIDLARQASLMPELKPEELPFVHCATEGETQALKYVDFSHPDAMELCRRALRQALDLGEAGSMVDYGDLVPDDAQFYDGRRGAEMHNFYYYDYQRTVSEIFSEKRGDDFILYARGAAPGTQRWVGQFAGDHPANFNGLRHVLTGALNLCACGYSNWGSDLGGYFGFPQPSVYMRWFQFGCFSPLMRPHGTAPRDPWYFGDAAVANYKFLAWTRENLVNYTWNAAAIAHESGLSIMRSMPVAFPGEPRMAGVGDQYMFGPGLLVAPVLDEETSRTVVFPSGAWTSLWDGKTIRGPAGVKVDAPLDTIPVYLRPGAVVPVELSRELRFGASMTAGRYDALVVTLPEGDESTALLNARGETAHVAAQRQSADCTWTLENFPEMSYVLVYGTTAATQVKVDGSVLPRATAGSFASMPAGWKIDSAGNRLVIRLASPQKEHSQKITIIEVEFRANAKRIA